MGNSTFSSGFMYFYGLRNSAGITSFLFFTSFWRSKFVLFHLYWEVTCLLRNHKQEGNNAELNANEIISQISKQQLGGRFTYHVSNKIFEFRKLIKMIISTYFLCWRSNFKTSCFGFHQVSKRSKTIKPLGPRLHGLKCFLAFGNLMGSSHLSLK